MVAVAGGGGQEYNRYGRTQKDDLNKKYGKAGKSIGGDIGRTTSRVNNALGNAGADAWGGVGKLMGYLTGNKNFSNMGNDIRNGQNIYSHKGFNTPTNNRRPAPTPTSLPTPIIGGHKGTTDVWEDPNKELGFMEMLAKAMGMTGGTGGGADIPRADFSAPRADLQNRAATGDSKLSQMYAQLQGEYASQAAPIQQTFAKSGEAIQSSSNAAAANVDAAAGAAQSQQSAQMEALGIGDAAGVLASQGGEAARDAAVAKMNIEQSRTANAGANTANAQSAGQFNTQIGQAAGLQGATQRGQLQGQLQQRMAELSMQEQQANQQIDMANRQSRASSASNSMSQALSLVSGMQGDRDRKLEQTRYDQTRQDNLDQSAFDNQQSAAEFYANGEASSAKQSQLEGIPAMVSKQLASMGVTPDDPQYAQKMNSIVNMLQLTMTGK